jgi:hypothetical protein
VPIYLLTPLHLDAPEWKYSTRNTPVQLEATHADDARIQATVRFSIAAEIKSGQQTVHQPWGNPRLVRVELVAKPDPTVQLIKLNDPQE